MFKPAHFLFLLLSLLPLLVRGGKAHGVTLEIANNPGWSVSQPIYDANQCVWYVIWKCPDSEKKTKKTLMVIQNQARHTATFTGTGAGLGLATWAKEASQSALATGQFYLKGSKNVWTVPKPTLSKEFVAKEEKKCKKKRSIPFE
ncbi:hypothetical protein T439DRAFT_325162 [Meredithblackwellia eburnea MCA 4105]